MRKEVILFCLLSILCASIVSASYECPSETEMLEDQEELDTYEEKLINGVGVGLVHSDEAAAIGRITAEIFYDAAKVILTNETPSEKIELFSDEYDISVTNITNNIVEIKLDGGSDNIEEGDTEEIKGYKVFLINFDGTYPGTDWSVEIMIGKGQLGLDNKVTPKKIIELNNTEYLFELFSASDNSAIITVKKCKDGSDFIEIEDEPVCDSNNLNLCLDETTCTGASGYWYDDKCNEEEKEEINETSDEGANESGEEGGNGLNESEDIGCEIGAREGETYCDENKEFVSQIQEGESCENDYECKSNLCETNICAIKRFSKIPGFNLETLALAGGITIVFLIIAFFLMRNKNEERKSIPFKSPDLEGE